MTLFLNPRPVQADSGLVTLCDADTASTGASF